ncbi:DUF2235 domain-containing protein [Mesorhizobium sp. B2-3-3]|nr:DUF2235 domain-containing protein [Mesorhizobium sp. B2-3-3]
MAKRIIILLDGTWNDVDFSKQDTNIVRLRNIISANLGSGSAILAKAVRGPELKPGQKIAAGRTTNDGQENLVFYERGVGTNGIDKIRGGLLGAGLDASVRSAYKFLSFYYRPGDSIFIFGFSRGAYSARTLAGYIAAAGLLKRDSCTRHLEGMAWAFYRTPPNDRLPGVWASLSPYMHNRDDFRIDCLGVFDTVGALGVPLNLFSRLNRNRFEFHTVELSSVTKVNLQALAIDEHRQPFQAAVWRKPRFKSLSSVTEQVWFSGVHADVGGGYWTDEQRRQWGIAIDDIPLDWMLKRIGHFFPQFPFRSDREWATVGESWSFAPHHNSRSLPFRFMPSALRVINNSSALRGRAFETIVCQDRNADPIGEMVHVSALNRLGARIYNGEVMSEYYPANLIASLKAIEATYGLSQKTSGRYDLLVVDWSGVPMDPKNPRDVSKIRILLESVRNRVQAQAH